MISEGADHGRDSNIEWDVAIVGSGLRCVDANNWVKTNKGKKVFRILEAGEGVPPNIKR